MENLTYHLEGVIKSKEDYQDFEGPLNLILTLLAKNKIEIRDIQISLILDQYLEQIRQMQEMDLEVASEFVQMASHLLYLKTRTLLAGEEEEISELDALISSLEQLKCRDAYLSVKGVTEALGRAAAQGLLLMDRPPEPLPKQKYGYRHEPVELLKAMAAMLSRGGQSPDAPPALRAVPRPIVYGVRTKSRQIVSRLRAAGELSLRALYAESGSRSELVATFLSILELCAGGGLRLAADGDTGDYRVFLRDDGEAERILETLETQDEGEEQNGTA